MTETDPSETSDNGEPKITFADLGLSDVMLAAIAAAQYHEPSPVQAGVIPVALTEVDLVGQARTGTGKTAAFAIPILELMDEPKRPHLPQALILVPTRELAVQVRGEVTKLSHGRKVRCVALYGGKPIKGQIDKLQKGIDVVVGTPGRVLDHMGRGTLRFDQLKIVVLDEADRMLDIGFRPDIEKILRKCPQSRQTLLLSATVPPPIERLANRYMREPKMLNFSSKDMSVDTIEQFYFTVEPQRKFDLLKLLLVREDPTQAIVFCRTKRGTDKIYQRLSKKMKGIACIHGDMAQGARDRTMSDFREGKQKVLIATDVVGRGIDVSGISHIINYDLPQSCDDYVHRVGRTGRMGRDGVAYSFVTSEEGNELTRIEMRINRLLTRAEIDGFDVRDTVAPDVAAASSAAAGSAAEKPPEEPAKPPAKTMANRRRKRYRRAL